MRDCGGGGVGGEEKEELEDFEYLTFVFGLENLEDFICYTRSLCVGFAPFLTGLSHYLGLKAGTDFEVLKLFILNLENKYYRLNLLFSLLSFPTYQLISILWFL